MLRFQNTRIFWVKDPNWSEEVFVVSKIKNTVPWIYVIIDLNGDLITGSFCEN